MENDNRMKSFYGEENHQTEFKTSFVFPNDKERSKDQHYEIFRAMCSFMNADGGILYIGVNDDGYATGLNEDLKKMQCRYPKFKCNTDWYSRHIYDQMCNYFKNADYVKELAIICPDNDNGNVIKVTVRKSQECVVYLKDGKAYQRTGTRTELMTGHRISQRIVDLSIERDEIREKTEESRKYTLISEAISRKKKVRLIQYHSGNSDSVRDRIVEPINFVYAGDGIWCYEQDSADCHLKQFKLSRMSDVHILNEGWEYESEHLPGSTDVFRWTGSDEFDVSMYLNVSARNLMVEEYPETMQNLVPDYNGGWYLNVKVHSLEPVCRFCVAWADKVVIYSEDLINAVRNYVNRHLVPSLAL